MRSLIAVDVDGTLIDASHRVAEPTKRAIAAAVDAGVTVVVASARGPAQLAPIFEQVPQLGGGFAVMFQGALVARVDGSEVLVDQRIDATSAEAVAQSARAVDATVSWFADSLWQSERADAILAAEERIIGHGPSGIGIPVGIRPHKVMVMVDPSRADVLIEVQGALPASVQGVRSHAHYLEVTAAGVSKGTAVRLLAAGLGVQPERTGAVGDGENDLPMFAFAHASYAMGNASAAVRAAATQVVPTNIEYGCAVAIEAFAAQMRSA